MIIVQMVKYWNEDHREILRGEFESLDALADWMFGQICADYSSDYGKRLLSFPQCAVREQVSQITVRPWHTGYMFQIKMIEDEQAGIIFSDGTFTAGQKHCIRAVRRWLLECEKRRRQPVFHFAPDNAVIGGTAEPGSAGKENPG